MRILIDGMNLALSQGTGVATYARNLSYCIRSCGHHLSVLYGRETPAHKDPLLREAAFFEGRVRDRTELEYYTDLVRSITPERPVEIVRTGKVLREEIATSLPDADRFFNLRSLFFKASAKFEHTGGLLEVAFPEKIDIAHWTYPVPARVKGAKNIYTFHDLVPIKLPYTTLDVKSNYVRMLKKLARTADHVVTVSEVSKRDITEMLNVPASKVSNTYQSVNIPAELLADSDRQIEINLEAISPAGDGEKSERRVRKDEFFLYVGAIEPKKNLKRIIEAYLASGVQYPLVVVGRQAWQCKEEMALIGRGGDRIIYLDYVPFSQVITLMRSARALVFASLYEGFGLPVLEAFLCGAPVITAAASSTEEVAGDAALLVDPYDTREIRDAFRLLSDGESDALRRDLTARGLKRAEAFSQEAIAERLDGFYRDLMAA